jgi:hypothetical protein
MKKVEQRKNVTPEIVEFFTNQTLSKQTIGTLPGLMIETPSKTLAQQTIYDSDCYSTYSYNQKNFFKKTSVKELRPRRSIENKLGELVTAEGVVDVTKALLENATFSADATIKSPKEQQLEDNIKQSAPFIAKNGYEFVDDPESEFITVSSSDPLFNPVIIRGNSVYSQEKVLLNDQLLELSVVKSNTSKLIGLIAVSDVVSKIFLANINIDNLNFGIQKQPELHGDKKITNIIEIINRLNSLKAANYKNEIKSLIKEINKEIKESGHNYKLRPREQYPDISYVAEADYIKSELKDLKFTAIASAKDRFYFNRLIFHEPSESIFAVNKHTKKAREIHSSRLSY